MAQMTLTERPTVQQQAAPAPRERPDSQEGRLTEVQNPELTQFLAEMEAQNEGYCYYRLKALVQPEIDGSKKVFVDVEYVKEMPAGFLGSAYGQGGAFDMENPAPWFEAVFREKEQDMRSPYKDFRNGPRRKVDHHEEYYFYRLLKAKNYRVFVDQLVLERLRSHFDLQAWLQRFSAVAGRQASAEYDAKVRRIMDLLEQGHDLSKPDGQIDRINSTICGRLGMPGRFFAKPVVWPEYAH